MVRRFPSDGSVWKVGGLLAGLNVVLAGACGGAFFGTLAVVTYLNDRAHAHGAPFTSDVRFPFPLLLSADAAVCIGAWIWAGRRVPTVGRPRFLAALLGMSPVLALALLGYGAAGAVVVVDRFQPDRFPAMGAYVFAALATLTLVAAIVGIGLVFLSGRSPRRASRAPRRPT